MFNNKSKYTLLLFFSAFVCVVNGQQIYLEAGTASAYFKDYVNNLGENSLDLSYDKPQEIFFESGFRFNIYKERLKLNAGLGYHNYKINTGFFQGNVSIPLTYNLNYASLKTGFIFNIVNEPKFKFQIHTHLSYDLLLSGTNEFRNIINDIYKDNTFDKTLIRFHKGVSAEYILSDTISTYVSYNIADSFREVNQDSNIEEIYTFHTNAISCGIILNIGRPASICYGGF
jgi:hypothetical protein